MDILDFKREHGWLSNFWLGAVMLDGVSYPSVEHAYQAAKTHPSQREPFLRGTPWQAKRLGRSVALRPDWEQVKVQTMRSLLEQKFAAGTQLGDMLMATGDGQIVEGNYWGDVFWGVCRGRGQNMLGRLLMEQRAALQATHGQAARPGEPTARVCAPEAGPAGPAGPADRAQRDLFDVFDEDVPRDAAVRESYGGVTQGG